MCIRARGYTEADVSAISSPLFGGASLSTPTLDGYVLGGGGEFSLGSGVFLQTQYTYSDYDAASSRLGGPGSPWSVGMDTEVHTGRVGLLYKFSFGADGMPKFEK